VQAAPESFYPCINKTIRGTAIKKTPATAHVITFSWIDKLELRSTTKHRGLRSTANERAMIIDRPARRAALYGPTESVHLLEGVRSRRCGQGSKYAFHALVPAQL
jgi:hypothetical protein